MNEFDLIARYFSTEDCARGVSLGIGDDCCLLQTNNRKMFAVSVDTLVSGVHFPANASAKNIAERALRVCLSDLAAIAAEPKWFTLALTLPDVDESWLKDFSAALKENAELYNCSLVGGDTTKGPLAITLQVMGEVLENEATKRSAACPGDAIYVTGTLGDAAAALAAINGEIEFGQSEMEFLLDRFYRPMPRFYEQNKIRGLINAAIDISDGLLADLKHICDQSHVAAQINLEALPFSDLLEKFPDSARREKWALTGGDDYELCFTVAGKNKKLIDEMTLSGTLNATEIGSIMEGSGVHCYKQDQLIQFEQQGYLHFE